MNQERGAELDGITAMQWARELSKLPDGDFTLCFFPYSRQKEKARATLTVKEHCKWRAQPNADKMEDSTVSQDNLLHFTDGDGQPRTCWRILIRYMAFSQDGYRLHKINWLGNERQD